MPSNSKDLGSLHAFVAKTSLPPADLEALASVHSAEDLNRLITERPGLQGRLLAQLQTDAAREALGQDYDALKSLVQATAIPVTGRLWQPERITDPALASTGMARRFLYVSDEQILAQAQRLDASGRRGWSLNPRRWFEQAQDNLTGLLSRHKDLLDRVMRFTDVLPEIQGDASLVYDHFLDYFPSTDKRLPWYLNVAISMGRQIQSARLKKVMAWVVQKGTETMAKRFISGTNATDASPALGRLASSGMGVIADILGEAVQSEAEADKYQQSYLDLIDGLAANKALIEQSRQNWSRLEKEGKIPLFDKAHRVDAQVSLKLSSLYSQWNVTDPEGTALVVKERLRPILRKVRDWQNQGIRFGLTIDLEQFQYRDLTYKIFTEVMDEPEFATMENVGVVVQAYLKDSLDVIERLARWSEGRQKRENGRSILVRLVKGAYWDYENIQTDQKGYPLPVFPEKWMSDVNYELATTLLFDNARYLRASIASHNLRSISHAIAQAKVRKLPMEVQMLYGMADDMKAALVKEGVPISVYCPVGSLLDGMAYLARRFLENTSQDSFLQQKLHGGKPITDLVQNPLLGHSWPPHFNEQTPSVFDLHAPYRRSALADFSQPEKRTAILDALKKWKDLTLAWHPMVGGSSIPSSEKLTSLNPSNPTHVVGEVSVASPQTVSDAVRRAKEFQTEWAVVSVNERASILLQTAFLIDQNWADLTALVMVESGKSLREADADVKELKDFLVYYAREAVRMVDDNPDRLLTPKGVTGVIAPWNFPLAILGGMTAAALVTGNTVVMKPSEETPITAAFLYSLFRQAGTPENALHYVPGGAATGQALVENKDVEVLAFTGSAKVGLKIYETMAPKGKTVIAEMGGKNALIVDADAHPDDVIRAVLNGAFGYAGQKCSAIDRLIIVGDEARYQKLVARLVEAIKSLKVGPVDDLGAFYNPVIRAKDVERLNRLLAETKGEIPGVVSEGVVLYDGRQHALPQGSGYFVGPSLLEVTDPKSKLFQEEFFGPLLTVTRAKSLDRALVLAQNSRYALTGGYLGRSPSAEKKVLTQWQDVGNLYLYRDESGTTGAVVGENSFGGQRLSGINGSKAGGGSYLWQFVKVTDRNTEVRSVKDAFHEAKSYIENRLKDPNQEEHLVSPMGIENRVDYRPRGLGVLILGDDAPLWAVASLFGAAMAAGSSVEIYAPPSLVPQLNEVGDQIPQGPAWSRETFVVRPLTDEQKPHLEEVLVQNKVRWVASIGSQTPSVDLLQAAAATTDSQLFVRSLMHFDDPLAEREKLFSLMTEPRTLSINRTRHGFDAREKPQLLGGIKRGGLVRSGARSLLLRSL